MWHEARRQERKIRGMLVDYRRRAERRRDFYEKIKADPTQFLQVHGRQCKIHLDPAIAAAADNSSMMPWQGQSDNLIDRFDGRAHLDFIPPVQKEEEVEATQEERHLNYERYRIIAQNAFLGITEEKFLKQLHLEEQFGYTEIKATKKEAKTSGAAIGFNYEEGTGIPQPPALEPHDEEDSDEENSDSDLDVDLAINVSKIDSTQAHEMNNHGRSFGMTGNDFYSFLTNDLEEAESYRLAKEEEHEKALFSGRKSRRERRAHREKRLANRVISPPSYAARESPTYSAFRDESKSPSKSPSPENAGKITYITSFGEEEEAPSGSSKPTYADKVKYGKASSKKRKESSAERCVYFGKKCSRSNSREVTYGIKKSSRSRSRSRKSSSRSRSKKRSRSGSRSRKSWSGKSRRSGSSCRRSRSKSGKTRSRSRESRSKESRSRRSRSRSKERYLSKSAKSYRRRSTSSSSSTSTSRSRSKSSKSSRSISRSISVSPGKILHKSKSRSNSPSFTKKESPPKVVSRYYGRRKSDLSSSESEDSGRDDSTSQDVEMKPAYNSESKSGVGNNSGTTIKKSSNLTVIERLKRKRQLLLNRQFKKDKIAEELKLEREKQEQQTREDELREMAIKLRRRQREKRHAYDSKSSSASDSEKSTTNSISTENKERNASHSPPRKERDREKSRDRDPRKSDRDRTSRDNSRRGSRERDRIRRSRSRDKDRGRSERDYDSKKEKDNRRERDRDRDRRSPSPNRRYNRHNREDNRVYRDRYNNRDNRDRRRDEDYRDVSIGSSRKLVDY